MTFHNDPSSRFQVRARGDLQTPGSCYVCGSGTCDEGYLDFGTFVDYHGSFYLCLICARQAAEAIGFFSPDEVQTTQALMVTLREENEALTKELDYARPIISAIKHLPSSDVQPSSDPVSPTVEADAGDDVRDSDGPKGSDEGEPDTPQPFNRPGRRNTGRTAKRDITFSN